MSKTAAELEKCEKVDIPYVEENFTSQTWKNFWDNMRFMMILCVIIMGGHSAYERRLVTWEAADLSVRIILTAACLSIVVMPIFLYFTYYMYFDLKRKDRAKAARIEKLAEGGAC